MSARLTDPYDGPWWRIPSAIFWRIWYWFRCAVTGHAPQESTWLFPENKNPCRCERWLYDPAPETKEQQ